MCLLCLGTRRQQQSRCGGCGRWMWGFGFFQHWCDAFDELVASRPAATCVQRTLPRITHHQQVFKPIQLIVFIVIVKRGLAEGKHELVEFARRQQEQPLRLCLDAGK